MTAHFSSIRAMLYAGVLCIAAAEASAEADLVLKRDLTTSSTTTCVSETAFGNLVTDAIKKRNGADIGLVNCAAIRGNMTYSAGTEFTAVAVAAELGDQKLALMDVTGAQLLEALEQAVAALPAASNSFPQISGIRMVVDVAKPSGTRIRKLTVNGTALDFAKTYRIATSEAVAMGGEGYAVFKAAKPVTAPTTTLAAEVTAFVEEKGVQDVKELGRIKFGQ